MQTLQLVVTLSELVLYSLGIVAFVIRPLRTALKRVEALPPHLESVRDELRDELREVRDAVVDVVQALELREGSTMRRLRARQRQDNDSRSA